MIKYFSEAEERLIKNTFKEEAVLSVLQKLFIGGISISNDKEAGYLSDFLLGYTGDEANEEFILKIRRDIRMIKHLNACIQQLRSIANQKNESDEERSERLKKNSTR